ncbi:MAG TPA: hypothetical protein VM553_06160 [Dongiaceae bacterium]|nr:hypothetical protein [Dongiaceae bacterium]
MNSTLTKKGRWIMLGQAGLLTACTVTATQYLWQSQVDHNKDKARLLSSAFDHSGNLYQLFQEGTGDTYDLYLRKVASDGTESLQPTLLASGTDPASRFDQVTACDNGAVLSGIYNKTIKKLKADGNTEWEHTFDGSSWDVKVTADEDCSLLVTRERHASGGSTVNFQEVHRLSAQGQQLWSQPLDPLTPALGSSETTSYLLDSGATLVLVKNLDQPLSYFVLDAEGTLTTADTLSDTNTFLIGVTADQILVQHGDNTIEGWTPEGSLVWAQTAAADLHTCADPTPTALLCFGMQPDTYQHVLTRFDLTDGTNTQVPVNYTGSPGLITNLGGDRWLVEENILADNGLGRLAARPLYQRLHILDDANLQETTALTLQPGKSSAQYLEEAGSYIWVQSSPGDYVQTVQRQGQQLRVSGWFGYQHEGTVQAKAYAIK